MIGTNSESGTVIFLWQLPENQKLWKNCWGNHFTRVRCWVLPCSVGTPWLLVNLCQKEPIETQSYWQNREHCFYSVWCMSNFFRKYIPSTSLQQTWGRNCRSILKWARLLWTLWNTALFATYYKQTLTCTTRTLHLHSFNVLYVYHTGSEPLKWNCT